MCWKCTPLHARHTGSALKVETAKVETFRLSSFDFSSSPSLFWLLILSFLLCIGVKCGKMRSQKGKTEKFLNLLYAISSLSFPPVPARTGIPPIWVVPVSYGFVWWETRFLLVSSGTSCWYKLPQLLCKIIMGDGAGSAFTLRRY